jgi:hypothetical protein
MFISMDFEYDISIDLQINFSEQKSPQIQKSMYNGDWLYLI